jgi:hypothetical protein
LVTLRDVAEYIMEFSAAALWQHAHSAVIDSLVPFVCENRPKTGDSHGF